MFTAEANNPRTRKNLLIATIGRSHDGGGASVDASAMECGNHAIDGCTALTSSLLLHA